MKTLRRLLITVSMAALLALSGCSGGGGPQMPLDEDIADIPDDDTTAMPDDDSSNMPDDDTTAMPDDDSSNMPDDDTTAMPDDDSSDIPDDDTTAMPDDDVQPLTIPEGLARSTATPVHADDAGDNLATLLSEPANLFAPVAALLRYDYSEQSPGTELASDLRVETVSSDGDNGFHVTYMAGGEEQTIHFEVADYDELRYDEQFNEYLGGYYSKSVDGVEYTLGSHAGSFERADKNQGPSGYRYSDHNYFIISDYVETRTEEFSFISYGARTDTSSLPAGEATYVGSMWAFTAPKDSSHEDQTEMMRGGMRLKADFSAGTLDGRILGISVLRVGESEVPAWAHQYYAYSPLPDTTWFEIDHGRIVDGQLAATLTGMDSNAGAAMDDTVRGYEGAILGEFYGPAAEEVGGVLNAEHSDRVMVGTFGGTQSDPNGPNGLVASTAAPVVYAEGGYDPYPANDLDDLLELDELFDDDDFEGGTPFAPLTSTLLRDYSAGSVKLVDDSHVKAIWVDAAGAHVSYVVEGMEHMVVFTEDDLIDGYLEQYRRDEDYTGNSWWSHTRSFDTEFGGTYDYFDVNTFSHWGGDPWVRHHISYGLRTEASDLPTGSATYTGGMNAENYNQGDPENRSSRIRMKGDLNLMANFDESTLEGAISGIDVRRPGEDDYSPLPDTTHFMIGNGRIADGRFTATLTGMDTNPAAPLRDSVRDFQGDVLGEFYGPAAEEVGGVFSATRNEDFRVMGGTFHGKQQP